MTTSTLEISPSAVAIGRSWTAKAGVLAAVAVPIAKPHGAKTHSAKPKNAADHLIAYP
jgi:hypothetical protein